MEFVSLTGFSCPAEAMGSCWSCLYRDPIRDNHLTKFKVHNSKITLNLTRFFLSDYHLFVTTTCTVCIHVSLGFNNCVFYSLFKESSCYDLSPCPRSPMWMMRATNWALGSWSSPRPSSFFTHVRGTPSDGHISACDATAMTPTCSLLRAVVAVRRGRVSNIFSASATHLETHDDHVIHSIHITSYHLQLFFFLYTALNMGVVLLLL